MTESQMREAIGKALAELPASSINMLLLDIEQFGKIGFYGRLAITNGIVVELTERGIL